MAEQLVLESKLRRYKLIAFAVWSMVFGVSLVWNVIQAKQITLEIAFVQIRLALEKDVLYRHWNAEQSGVYVEISEAVQPNPYLAHIPERDIVTPSGRRLTLVNPAYMTRQVNELWKIRKNTTLTRITSLQPINQLNTPDPWEAKALAAVARGEQEVSTVEKREGVTVLRLLQPFITEKSCLKCHAVQGAKEGEIRGAISVLMVLDPLLALEQQKSMEIWLGHLALWGIGVVGILLAMRQLQRTMVKQLQTENELTRSRKVESIGLLAGGMAHDFNNLLSVICGNIGIIKVFGGPKSEERLNGSIRAAEQACGQAKDLGQLLLDLATSADPKREALDLKKLTTNLLSQIQIPPNVTSQAVFSENLWAVRGNYRMIYRVLHNLATNAMEAMPDGGVLEVSAYNHTVDKEENLAITRGDYVELSFKDTGIGIAEAILPKIFEPYFSTKNTYSRRGLGLGLAVCEVIVKRLGGLITVVSTVGVGTVFTIYLQAVSNHEENPHGKEN